MKNKTPVVLFIAESFNISSSWRRNALFNAIPENFINFWQKYPHTLLTSTENSPEYLDDQTDFIILGGSQVKSKKDQIEESIKNGSFFDNPKLNKFISNVNKTNSALHLFSCISEKRNESNLLMAFLKLAKLSKSYRTYVHILIDEPSGDPRNILAQVSAINQKMEKDSLGEIASITGASNINDKSSLQAFQKSLKEIVSGSGSKTLSPEQGLTKKLPRNTPLNKFQTATVFRQNKPISRINNFDNIIFTNSDVRDFNKLALSFITPEQSPIRGTMPRMINVASLYPLFGNEFEKYQCFFSSAKKTFPSLLTENNYSQLYISDSSRILHLKEYLQVPSTTTSRVEILPCSDGEGYLKNLKSLAQSYAKTAKYALESNQYDFIMVDLPFLFHSFKANQFKKSLESIHEIDRVLSELEKTVHSRNGALIFTSINNRALAGGHNKVFAPFIFSLSGISKDVKYKAKEFPNRIMYEMLRKKYAMIDIAPTILDLFKIERSSHISGDSLLSSKILI